MVREISRISLMFADANGLENTPAVATLRSAMETAERGLDPSYTTPINRPTKSRNIPAHIRPPILSS
jgi:hypothetical protein